MLTSKGRNWGIAGVGACAIVSELGFPSEKASTKAFTQISCRLQTKLSYHSKTNICHSLDLGGGDDQFYNVCGIGYEDFVIFTPADPISAKCIKE